MTNPLSRLEVIMQTSSLTEKSITVREAVGEVMRDTRENGLRGMFRGQGAASLDSI